MKRREIITLLGTAAAWPLTAWAQEPKMPTIGFLHARSREDTSYMVAVFRQTLADAGFEDGKTLRIEWRFADGQYDRLKQMAADLVAYKVALIVAGTDFAALAAKEATTNIPIVFTAGRDPVELKLVDSINKPAGNATGISVLTVSLEPKRLGLFRDVLGPDRTIAVLMNPNAAFQLRDVESAASAIGWKTKLFWASADAEIDKALEQIEAEGVAALEVEPDPFFDIRGAKLASWAIQKKIPTMFQFRRAVQEGGLMSYGIDLSDVYRQVGLCAARILKGEEPGSLPVLQPTKFEFVVNMRTAKVLGLVFPPDLISIADEVID